MQNGCFCAVPVKILAVQQYNSKRDECGPGRAAVCKQVWMLVCKLTWMLWMLYRDVKPK